MEWWGPKVRLEFLDEPGELFVQITYLRRNGDLIWPIGLGVVGLVAMFHGSWWLCAGSFLVGILSLAGWHSPSTASLTVTLKTLDARSCSRWNSNLAHVRWLDIRRLEYRVGGEDESPGLYATKSFWTSTCLVPNIDREQTEQLIDAIYERFPLPDMLPDNDDRPGFFKSTLTTLGLSGPDKQSESPRP